MVVNNNGRTNDAVYNDGILANGYGLAPRMVMRDKRLSIEAKAIYCYLQSLAGSSGRAFPKRETIISDLGISKDRYYKYLKQLTDLDYIRLEKSERTSELKGRNIYIMVSCPGTCETDAAETEKKAGKAEKRNITVTAERDITVLAEMSDSRKHENKSDINISIAQIAEKYPEMDSDLKLIEKAVSDMQMSDSVSISGSVKSHEAVMGVLSQLEDKHLLFVLDMFICHKKNIKNKRAWLQVCIFNSIFEEDSTLEKHREALEIRTTVKEKTAQGATNDADAATDDYANEMKREISGIFCKLNIAKIKGDYESVEKYKNSADKLDKKLKEYISGVSLAHGSSVSMS